MSWWLRIFAAVGGGLGLALLGLLCLTTWDAHLSARASRATVAQATATLAQGQLTLQQVSRTTIILGGAAADLQKTLAIERAAATAQIAASTHALADVDKLIGKLNGVADSLNVDAAKGGFAADALNAAIVHQDVNLSAIGADAQQALIDFDAQEKQLGPLFAQGTIDLRDADALFLNPDISATLHHINSTMASVDDGTAHVDAWVDRETAPIRGTWNVLKEFLFQIAGPAAAVATAAK